MATLPEPRRARRILGLVGACLVAGCAPIPPPDVLAELERVKHSPAAAQAAERAPTARAHADQLFAAAEQALADDDFAGAQILGEQALAAYEQAVALARAARAEEQRVAAEEDERRGTAELAKLHAEEQALAADVTALEARLEALREAESIVPSGPASGEREAARARATATLRLQARLLCTSARMLQAAAPAGAAAPAELGSAEAALAALDALLASPPPAAPIDQATRVRAACLGALSAVRHASADATTGAATSGAADRLLPALSALRRGAPRRDERGVVVTLESLFTGDALSPGGRAALADLATVAAAHPGPVLVVLHQDRAPADRDLEAWRTRGALVLGALGVPAGRVEVAGTAAPLVDPASAHHARNERVEIVFVAPALL
ncbi:MAG: hypothetical protein IT373_24305 [Polyangiaceae bacterium]|nr:hypothetical protein [Polyangiaceae bacterium]